MRFPLSFPLSALVGAVAFALTAGVAASPGNDAVTYLVNPAHTSVMYTPNLSPPLTKKWTVNLGAAVSYPLIAQGNVYVVAGTNLYALNAATGQNAWGPVAVTGSYSEGYIAYDAGKIFLVNFDGLLKAYDAAAGTLLWSQQMPNQYAFSSTPTAVNGTVYVVGAGVGGTLYAVNETDGSVRWTEETGGGDDSSPVVAPDGIYVSYAGPQSYKLDTATGSLIWHYSAPDAGGGGDTPVLYNDQLYIRDVDAPSSTSNNVYILDALGGTLLGGFDQGYENNPSPPAFDNGMGFFVTPAGVLTANNLNFTSTAWTFAKANEAITNSPLVVNGVVYVGTTAGNLYGVNETTGQQIWTDSVGSAISASSDSHVALAAGDSLLAIPAGNTLVAYAGAATTPAPALTSFTLDPDSITGSFIAGAPVTATVTLNVFAAAGGQTVLLSSSLPGVVPLPASVTVPAGASSVSFPIPTVAVSSAQTATLTANLGGVSRTVSLTVQPPGLTVLTLNPVQVLAGDSATGMVTLGSPAPVGGVSVALSSSDPTVTVMPSVSVPAGATTANFPIMTSASATTALQVTITAALDGTQQSATLVVQVPKTIHVHLLWRKANGTTALWTVNKDNTYTVVSYGPFAGWTATALAEGVNGVTSLMWTRTDGTTALWAVNPDATYTYVNYGPYPNWAAVGVSSGAGGEQHLLWSHSMDGQASLWSVNPGTFGSFSDQEYGPFSGYTARVVASGTTVTDLLWTNANGQAAGWSFAANGFLTEQIFGPYAGYTATSLSVGPTDDAHLLWDKTDGTAALWNVDFTSGAFTFTSYGPFSGYSARAIATDPNDVTHILWTAANGTTSLWSVTGSGYTHTEFGPFAGWNAVAISAGP